MFNISNKLQFHAADKHGLAAVKKLILDDKMDVNQQHSIHESRAVDVAAESGSLETLRFLIEEAKADIQATHNKNLLLLAASNTPDVIAYLTCPHTQLYKKFKDGTTDLHSAAFAGRLKEVETFLTKNPERINEANIRGENVLFWAIIGNQSEISKFLLTAGAEFPADTEDLWKKYSLWNVCANGHVDMVNLLLFLGTEPNAIGEEGEWEGFNLLHWAAYKGRAAVVKTLLGVPMDPNACVTKGIDWQDCTPVHLAASVGHPDVVRTLLEAKADPNKIIKKGPKEGYTPLHLAAKNGHSEVVQTLLAAKVDPHAAMKDGAVAGYTPIHLAADEGHQAVVLSLLEAKVDPNAAIKDGVNVDPEEVGFTPISIATMTGNSALLKTLVAAKADPNSSIKNVYRTEIWPLIHAAAWDGPSDVIQTLLDIKVEPNTPLKTGNLVGKTPMQLATLRGRKEVVQILQRAGVVLPEVKEAVPTPQKDSDPVPAAFVPAKSKPSAPPEKKDPPLIRAIDAIFLPSRHTLSEIITFDRNDESEFRKILKKTCRERDIHFTQDKLKNIMNALRAKVNNGKISMKDFRDLAAANLFQEKSKKPSVASKTESKKEGASKTIADKYAEFGQLKDKISILLAGFAEVNSKPTLDELIAPYTRDSLPTKPLKAIYSSCKGLLSQHETHNKLFDKIQTDCSLASDAIASVDNLKKIDTLIAGAISLHDEINNSLNTLKSQKESLSQELAAYKASSEKNEKKPNKNDDKTAAILAAMKNKKTQKEKRDAKKKSKQATAALAARGSAVYAPLQRSQDRSVSSSHSAEVLRMRT